MPVVRTPSVGVAHADAIVRETGVDGRPGVAGPPPRPFEPPPIPAALLTDSISQTGRDSSALGRLLPGSVWFWWSPDVALAKFLVPSESSVLAGVESMAAELGAITSSAAMHAWTVTPEQPPAMEDPSLAIADGNRDGTKPRLRGETSADNLYKQQLIQL